MLMKELLLLCSQTADLDKLWSYLQGGLDEWCSQHQLQVRTEFWVGSSWLHRLLACTQDQVQPLDLQPWKHRGNSQHTTDKVHLKQFLLLKSSHFQDYDLWSTLRTFQVSSTPLLTRAFWAMVDTAAIIAVPSSLCRQLLPTTTTGCFALAKTWRKTLNTQC